MEWFLKVVRDNYANFNGRARRKEFFMYSLIHALCYIPFFILMGIGAASESTTLMMTGLGLTGFLVLVFIIPTLAVSVRRLHDTGRSGWFYLLSMVPIGNIVYLIFLLQEGDPCSNEYGEDPKANERFV